MKNKSPLLIFAFIWLWGINGCATPVPRPSAVEITASDPGLPPANYEEQIKTYWSSRLIDPTAPLYTFEQPVKSYTTQLDKGTAYRFGWDVHFTLNSKNQLGGYTGRQSYIGFFLNGRLRVMYRDFGYDTIRAQEVLD